MDDYSAQVLANLISEPKEIPVPPHIIVVAPEIEIIVEPISEPEPSIEAE